MITKLLEMNYSLLFSSLKRLLIPQPKIVGFNQLLPFFNKKKCLEIGGPSSIFQPKSFLPLYPLFKSIDNVNFSENNIWSKQKIPFLFQKKIYAKEFIIDATCLKSIEDETYDCLISSHVLEHIANPLLALYDWKRVMKLNGIMVLILPHKSFTFDHNREITKYQHFLDDYNKEINEKDLSHLPEILCAHDLILDPEAGSEKDFQIRSKNNYYTRCLHHHVFVTETAVGLCDLAGFRILYVTTHRPYHIIVFAQKSNLNIQYSRTKNLTFLSKDAVWRKKSCFELDKEIL